MRTALGLIAGVALAIVVVIVVETLGHHLWPMPADVNVQDPAQLREIMDQIPLPAKLSVLIGWALGSLLGGFTAARISGRRWPAWAVGIAMLLAGGATMAMIPHPLWFMAATLPATLAPAWIAARFGPKRAV